MFKTEQLLLYLQVQQLIRISTAEKASNMLKQVCYILCDLLKWLLTTIYYFFRGRPYRPLRDKVVFLTGASSGIGYELARQLHQQGCQLILSARTEGKLDRLKDELYIKMHKRPEDSHNFTVPTVMPMDLSELSKIPKYGEDALSVYGYIDIVINCGGLSNRSTVLQTADELETYIMDVNYFGPLKLIKAFLPSMLARGSGLIVNISSLNGLLALPKRASYSASKHALQGMSDALRAEIEHQGIDVLVVSPGYIKTEMAFNAVSGDGERIGHRDSSHSEGLSVEECAKQIVDAMQSGRRELIVAPWYYSLAVIIREELKHCRVFRISEYDQCNFSDVSVHPYFSMPWREEP